MVTAVQFCTAVMFFSILPLGRPYGSDKWGFSVYCPLFYRNVYGCLWLPILKRNTLIQLQCYFHLCAHDLWQNGNFNFVWKYIFRLSEISLVVKDGKLWLGQGPTCCLFMSLNQDGKNLWLYYCQIWHNDHLHKRKPEHKPAFT